MAASLETLPVEMLDLICTFCSLPEVKALRLTSSTLRNVANAHLLRPGMVAFFHRESMDAVKAVASHAQIAKQVRSLCLNADRLEFFATSEEWNEWTEQLEAYSLRTDAVWGAMENQIPLTLESIRTARQQEIAQLLITAHSNPKKNDIPEAELRRRWDYYSRRSEDEDALLHTGHMRNCYAAFFKGCPSLDTIVFTMSHELRSITARQSPIFSAGLGLFIPHGDHQSECQGLEAMSELIKAAYDADFSPKILLMTCMTHYLSTEEDIVEEASAFLKNVETLQWRLSTPFINDDLDIDDNEYEAIIEDLEGGNLSAFLADTPNLRELELEMPEHEAGWAYPRLPTVVGDNYWPHLTSFSITRVLTRTEDLIGFLARHRTLQQLRLGEVELSTGDWPSCFKLLAGELPQLQNVELRGMFCHSDDPDSCFYWFGYLDKERGNKYERKVAHFLIEGGHEFPEAPEVMEGMEDEWESDVEEEVDQPNEEP